MLCNANFLKLVQQSYEISTASGGGSSSAAKPAGATKRVSVQTVWRHIASIDHHIIDMERPKEAGIYQRLQAFSHFWYYPMFPLKGINTSSYSTHDDKMESAESEDWSDPRKVPAIVVYQDAKGNLDLIDGLHRLAVAKARGINSLPAYLGQLK